MEKVKTKDLTGNEYGQFRSAIFDSFGFELGLDSHNRRLILTDIDFSDGFSAREILGEESELALKFLSNLYLGLSFSEGRNLEELIKDALKEAREDVERGRKRANGEG